MAKVLIAGSGAREHQLALSYGMDGHEVIITPGNEGMTYFDNFEIDSSTSLKDANSFLEAAKRHKPDLVDVAQDDALAAGTVDLLRVEGFRAFGPTRKAARIEWDKEWSRDFMERNNIPTPKHMSFHISALEDSGKYARGLIESEYETVFFKASGLYAGKGVVPVSSVEEIPTALDSISGMGKASERFLVEEGMVGEEFSWYAISDGSNFISFTSAQDNKRVWNRDLGLNTGGMGCNSPALVTKGLEQQIEDEIVSPTIAGMNREGHIYEGILYVGGIVREDGTLGVVEFNSRWGDPEAQVVLPGMKANYFNLVNQALDGKLDGMSLEHDGKTRVCLVGASSGYPKNYEKGKELIIPKDIKEYATILSAGIKVVDGLLYNSGGRVFNLVTKGDNILDARESALRGMGCCYIEDNGLHYRTDVSWKDVQRKLDSIKND